MNLDQESSTESAFKQTCNPVLLKMNHLACVVVKCNLGWIVGWFAENILILALSKICVELSLFQRFLPIIEVETVVHLLLLGLFNHSWSFDARIRIAAQNDSINGQNQRRNNKTNETQISNKQQKG
jgi:hypothetical protein